MPRVSIRRLCLYALYTLTGATLVMLAFHVQQQSPTWIRIAPEQPLQVEPVAATDDEEPAPAAAPEAVEEPAPADAQPSDVDEAALDDTTNGTSPFRLRGLPWYIKSDGYRPLAGEPLAGRVWPDESNGRRLIDDRIEAQLMIAPPKLPADVDDSDAPLKKIFLPNGLGSWQVKGGRGLFLEQKCPVDRCVLTSRRNDAATADAIMYKDYFTAPTHKRPPNQIWIMYMLECPLNTQFVREKDVFNWTATYRHDSELVAPYEKWVYFDPAVRRQPVTTNWAANKSKKVAWFVSNCGAKNKRLEYAHALQKYIDVDIYGSCGTKSCPRHSGKHCFDVLAKNYKFYLAFENSNCRDYITEKFYVNGLGSNVIPIVMGAPRIDYERHAPENSFIHVDDFATPKQMADFLHQLDANDTLYNEYFEWKEMGRFINTYFFCRLCAALHEAPRAPPRTYADFNQWWKGGFTCIKGSWRDFEAHQRAKKERLKNKNATVAGQKALPPVQNSLFGKLH